MVTPSVRYDRGALFLGQGVIRDGPRGALTRLDPATGAVVWTAENSNPLWNPPVIDGDAVVSVGDSLYRFDRETGAKRTLADTPGGNEPTPIRDGWIYGSATRPWKQHARTGVLAWVSDYVATGYNEVVVGDRVYRAAGGIAVLDDATGRLLHDEPSPAGSTWFVAEGAGLVVAQATNRLTAFRPGSLEHAYTD